ncbi:MAG: hypothetical protein VW547_05490 [Alphaproteobacteria bacterium]
MTAPEIINAYLEASPYKPRRALLILAGLWGMRERYRISAAFTGDTSQATVRELERWCDPADVDAALDAAINEQR